MAESPERLEITACGHRLEAEWHGPRPDRAPTLVLLHEGLGCVGMWRDWPARLVRESGLGVFAYSRVGYGTSDAIVPPRPLTYMHEEGMETLPEVLDAAGIRDAILVGHSDGASIALLFASTARSRVLVKGIVALAPHVFCEDVAVASIARARDAFVTGDLRARLSKYHGRQVDGAFWGWNRAWLDPDFRAWNIENCLPNIIVPTLLIQGEDDEYGTDAQLTAIERGIVRASVARLLLPDCKHSPHRDKPTETTQAVVAFAEAIWGRTRPS